jgi:hypothetical protein
VFQPSQIRVIAKEHEPEAQPKVAMPSKPPGNPDETYQEGSNGWALFEGKRTDALRNADVDKMLPMPIQAAKSDPIRDLVNYLDTPWRQKLEAFAEAFLDEWQEWVETEEDEDPVYPTEAEDPELDHFYEMNHRIKLYEDPLACPAWMFLDYKGTNTGWVVHFTNFAEDIAKNGFTKGVPEPDQLALTREREKPGPGYNFGFEAKNKHYVREAAYDERPGNYGRQAVLCKVEYVLCHHSTDRYEQAIFWGPDAKVRIPIIPQHGEDLYELIEKTLHENRKVKKQPKAAAGKFYHGSMNELKIGTILKPSQRVGDTEEFLEMAKPSDKLSRSQSVFLVDKPDAELITACGGDDSHCYEVQPLGKVERSGVTFFNELEGFMYNSREQYVEDEMNKGLSFEDAEAAFILAAREIADQYWHGEESDDGIMEYRTPQAKVIKKIW